MGAFSNHISIKKHRLSFPYWEWYIYCIYLMANQYWVIKARGHNNVQEHMTEHTVFHNRNSLLFSGTYSHTWDFPSIRDLMNMTFITGLCYLIYIHSVYNLHWISFVLWQGSNFRIYQIIMSPKLDALNKIMKIK